MPADRGIDDRSAPDLWLATAEGFQTFTVHDVSADEGLGTIPEMTIRASTADTRLDPSDLLGQLATLGVRTGPTSFRVRSAHVVAVSTEGVRSDGGDAPRQSLHIELRPWLYALTMTAGFATFEDVTVLDVARAVLGRYSFARVDFRVRADHPVHALVAQYGESDYAFVDRILGAEGLYYYFEHTPHGHTLVVTDDAPRAQGRLPVFTHEGSDPRRSVMTHGTRAAIGPTGYRVTVRDPRGTGADSLVESHAREAGPFGPLVVTESVDAFPTRAIAERMARSRLARMQRGALTFARTASPELEAGSLFTLRGHPFTPSDGAYRVIRGSWMVETYEHRRGAAPTMESSLELLPLTSTYAMPLQAAPVIPGPQTAVVIGPRPGEVSTDAQGRVRLRLRWPANARGEAPMAWVPVLGGAWRPRAGETVLVQFLEGDPSRPVLFIQPPGP